MSTTLTMTRDQLILAAFRKLGIVEPADTIAAIDAALVTNAAFNLNLIVKQMATKGLKLWTIKEYILPLLESASSYIVGPASTSPDLEADKPIKVIQAFLQNNAATPAIDTPISIISKQEYNLLSSKYTAGIPNSMYVNVDKTFTTINVWPTPDATTETNYSLYLYAQKQIDDLLTDVQIVDFPSEWYNALVWTLADDLAIEFEVPVNHRQELASRASGYRDQLEEWDIEYTSTYFTVDTQR